MSLSVGLKRWIMAKGYNGQSCGEAIRNCFTDNPGPLSFSQIMAQVKTKGDWKETTIWRHLMSTVVNLVPAKYEWTNEKFLFLRSDGRYELYDPQRHPETIE